MDTINTKDDDKRDDEHQPRSVVIQVNSLDVTMLGHEANGAQIKAAAIAQSVRIEPNFMLQLELPNGSSRVVGDEDEIHLRHGMSFTAIRPDDNS